MNENDIMFWPNIMTSLRVVVTPIICILISFDLKCYACFLFFIACISDFADGYIARKYNILSKFGQHFDSFADKLLISLTLISLLQKRIICEIHVIAVYIIISRILAIYFIRNYMIDIEAKYIKSDILGKFTTLFHMLSIFLLIGNIYTTISFVILWVSALISLISFINYYAKNVN